MAENLAVEAREPGGKLRNRRLRKSGKVPVVLYGHGEDVVCLGVSAQDLTAVINRGSRMVALSGAVTESAFIREVQWDTWGTEVVHVDFTRISADEKVKVRLSVELRGEAPGVRNGGVVEHLLHDIELECPAGSIPEKIRINVNELELDATITVGEIELPEGAVVLGKATAIVVQCVEPTEVLDEDLAEAVPGEPEVIGEKDEEAKDGK